MPLGEGSNVLWLNVGFGRLRKRCKPGTTGAIERELKDGTPTFAIEYTYISGTLTDVKFKDDLKFGKKWILFIDDDGTKYGVNLSEDSRFATDFLKKFPNISRNQFYKFTPYDFTPDGDKRKVGLSIKDKLDAPIENYYQNFTKEETGWNIENLHGYPEYTGKRNDKDDLKIYFIQVTKFLREQALEHIGKHFGDAQTEPDDQPITGTPPQDPELDDLPF